MSIRPHFTDRDEALMRAALSLARRGLGRTAPNPAVGCIIVHGDVIIGRGHTADTGRPHAEAMALEQAGARAKGGTVYVTLEPCAHEGKSGACAKRLIAEGIERCVVACKDPYRQVNGKGIAMMQDQGIIVDTGLLEYEAQQLNAGFFMSVCENRPLISLKLATTLDVCMATCSGESQWITGEAARRHAHLVRARHDAILTGIGTVLADNPKMTARLPGVGHEGVRCILDTDLRTPREAVIFQDIATNPVWIIYNSGTADQIKALQSAGAHLIHQDPGDLPAVMTCLARSGITRVLVEAGPTLSTAFIDQGLCDSLHWYRAPSLIGGDGRHAIGALHIESIDRLKTYDRLECRPLGKDLLEILVRDA